MTDVLAFLTFGESLRVALALAVYAAVIWMIVDILRRPDFSGLEKVLWSIAGLVFSIGVVLVNGLSGFYLALAVTVALSSSALEVFSPRGTDDFTMATGNALICWFFGAWVFA